MNKLSAWFAKNKKLALGGGGAAAVALGLYARSHKKAAGPTLSSVQPKSSVIAPATYDSTSADLYNSIEPLIEGLQTQINSLGQQMATPVAAVAPTVATPAPAPAPVAAPAPTPAPGPTPVVPQTVMSAPTIIGVAPPPPDPSSPGIIYQIPNPIAGDNSSVAVGTGAYPFIYGGSQAQVDMLTGNPTPAAPPPVPASWGISGTWADPHYSW